MGEMAPKGVIQGSPQAGIHVPQPRPWVPAFAGKTGGGSQFSLHSWPPQGHGDADRWRVSTDGQAMRGLNGP